MQDEENVAQRFFSGRESKDALAHLYKFFSYKELSPLARTCKDTQRVFKELTQTFYYVPNRALIIKKPGNTPCGFQYEIPKLAQIMQLYQPGPEILCFRTDVDAMHYIKLLYAQNPGRVSVPPIFELVVENARQLPKELLLHIANFNKSTLVRVELNPHILTVCKAKFMKCERGVLSPIKSAGSNVEYIDLQLPNRANLQPSQPSRCNVM
jgi:hypothetical protein